MEEEKLLDIEEIPDDIKHSPYSYICDFVEKLYPSTGKEVFEILSLVPISLIIPDLSYFSKTERTNMNVLFLAYSGSGKSSICKLFSKFCYYPLEGRSYTPAELENKTLKYMHEFGMFSLIIEDYATMSTDERINKIIEGVLGDEKVIDRHTTKKDIRESIEAVGLLAGVPDDLSNKITSGTLSRVLCVLIVHDDDKHSSIGKHISDNLGILNGATEKEKIIKSYYQALYEIQNNKINEYGKVVEFVIPESMREQIYKAWDGRTRIYRKQVPFNFFRELQDAYRILVSHCFLNYFNRKVKDGKMYVNQEDCQIALNLLKRNLDTKYYLFISEKMSKSIRSAVQLNNVINRISNERAKNTIKQLMPIHLKNLKKST